MSPNPSVPGYELLRLIASTGHTNIFAARDLALNREVAIKIPRHTLFPLLRERFLSTARLQARLPHPGITPISELGELPDGRPFLVMKLIRGQTLDQLLQERESPSTNLPPFLQVLAQTASTIGFAHSQRIIHRDLDPHSVMIGQYGEVQIINWGMAISLDDEQQEEGVFGRAAYMPPEQVRGERFDCRSDVFCLGGILCTILTGIPPFRGDNTMAIVLQSGTGDLSDAFARLDACRANPALIALCKRCLAPDPANRPPDGKAVAAALTAEMLA